MRNFGYFITIINANNMKRLLTAAVALICMTLNVPAQQATSILKQKGEKLAKAADADPQNWRKQFDACPSHWN